MPEFKLALMWICYAIQHKIEAELLIQFDEKWLSRPFPPHACHLCHHRLREKFLKVKEEETGRCVVCNTKLKKHTYHTGSLHNRIEGLNCSNCGIYYVHPPQKRLNNE